MTDQWQELKETITELRDNNGTGTQQEVCRFLANLMDVLEKQMSRSEKPNKWIPVSERLPKAGEYVGDVAKYYLVQNEYGDMLVARYTHSEYWEQMYQLNPIADEIVAWRELPEPYKAESEDRDGK